MPCLEAKVVNTFALSHARSMLVSIVSYLQIVMEMYVYRIIVAWMPRVENVSREVEEDGRQGKKAHATAAVWAGFHNENIWRRKVKAAS